MSKKTRAQDRIVKNAAKTVAARHAESPRKAEKENVEGATNVVDFAPASAVSSESTDPGREDPFDGSSANAEKVGERIMTLTRTNHNRKGSSIVFSLGDGHRGTVKFARSVFGANVPETLELNGEGFAEPSKPQAKMTKEERAAARAAMTPEQKIQRAKDIARKAAERAAKLEASLSVPA